MSNDYISREANGDDFVRRADIVEKFMDRLPSISVGYLCKISDEIPPADVRPVIPAFWQDGNKSNKNPEGHAFNWWCSNCGTPQHTPVAKTLAEFTVDNPYCHKCGATMVRSFENG